MQSRAKHAVTNIAPSIRKLSSIQLKKALSKSKDKMSSSNISNSATLKFKIPANGLLDFSVTSSPIHFKMTQGKDAEIHGYPLTKNKTYTINEGGIGIYSWRGCKVEVSGIFDNDKTKPLLIDDEDDESTPIKKYLMAHSGFRKIRDELSKITDFKCLDYDNISLNWSDFDIQRTFTANLDKMGPRILILGPINTGKSTLCKSLINWAQRLEDEPIFIDLDCGQNAISIPGTIGGDIIKDYHIPWKSFENTNHSHSIRNPFIYYFGNISPSHYQLLYKHYISVISMIMKKKMLCFDKQRSSGSIINTCGWIDGPFALSIIKHIINAFCINYIIVMEHKEQQKLLTFLHTVNKEIKYNIHICDLPPSQSIKTREQNQRYQKRQEMCKQYFYGDKISKKYGGIDNDINDEYDEEEEKKGKKKENEQKDDDDKTQTVVVSMEQFIDEYSPFERSYLFNELTVYEILKTFDENGDNYNSGSGSGYSCSSSSDRENNNNNGNKKKMKSKKYGNNNNRRKPLEVTYQYYDGSGPNNFKIKSKRFDDSMIGNIIAVTHAQKVEELLNSNVAGFLYIKDIDKDKKEIRVLQSCVGPNPGLCLFGRVKWDSNYCLKM